MGRFRSFLSRLVVFPRPKVVGWVLFKPVSSFTPYLNYPPYLSDTMQVTGSTAQEYDDPNTMMKDYVNCAAILEWESARAANGIYYAVGSATYNGFY